MGSMKIEELEGDAIATNDYFFDRIGAAVPLKDNNSNFDLETLPSQPLAVSERFRLIFVAHSSGFFVAKTKDVIDSAKESKVNGSGSSVQQLSLVDVPIGRVRILAVSTDNSMLAASVASDIRFYSVENFLDKEVNECFSSSLNDATFVKDMRWITTTEYSYVVLSNTGKLYCGQTGFPHKFVMDNVDAVDWGVQGSIVAVARKNVLSILSAKFEEKVSISLPFTSWIGDSEADCSVTVDSIKCVRPDSIVIGCFQLTEDGKEENYLIQVIRSKHGGINDDSSELVVQSFYDIYRALIDDIVPSGSGPYLLLAYLKQCQLVINANMKNTDDHVVLLGWSGDDDKGEAAVIDIERNSWLPKIELPENGDNNLLLGLCIDNVSIYQKIEVQQGDERTKLSPYCVLICLTLEGKLVMFHVASLAGSEISSEGDSAPHDDKDASVMLPAKEGSHFSHGLQKQELDKGFKEDGNLKSYAFANPNQITHTEDFSKHPEQEVKLGAKLETVKSNMQKMIPDVDANRDTDTQNQCPPGAQQKNLGQKTAAIGTSISTFTINSQSAAPGLSSYNNNLQETTERTKELWNRNSSRELQKPPQLLPSETFSFPKKSGKSDVSPFSASNYADGVGYQTQKNTMVATNLNSTNVPGSIGGKPFLVQGVNSVSPVIDSASRPVQSGGQAASTVAGNMQPVFDYSSRLSSNENTTAGKSSVRKFYPSNEQHGTSSKLGISTDLSKQFGNINEITKELDQLLTSIEEAGGFRDACTRSLQSSIEALEQGMDTLSRKCKMWMGQVDEHHEEVHHLLDKTIRVVARKIYMEGIYKQATDSRYWDLWNRQKLNSELETKRQHILSLNQDLTYQLIELERHFNALELNKFSQYGGRHTGHGLFQSRYGPSRYMQSLRSLHNAISSQLVAAENLSESLSKQMAALSLRSLSNEQKNVKELFETIGLPYDASYVSPDVKSLMKTPSSKKFLFSDLTTDKDQSKRMQTSAMKGCEPEMTRRRRDSLDQSWTCFEPPKTIIKRKLLQELQKPNRNESMFSMSKDNAKFSILEESAPHQIDARIPSIVPASKTKSSILDTHPECEEVSEPSKAIIQADNRGALTQVSESKSLVSQRNNILAAPSQSAFQFSPTMVLGHSMQKEGLAAEKSYVQKSDLISSSESKSILHKNLPEKFSISTHSSKETPLLLSKSSEVPITSSKMTMVTSSAIGDKLPSTFTPKSWTKDFPTSQSYSSAISSTSTLFGNVTKSNLDKSISATSTLFGNVTKSNLDKSISATSPLFGNVTKSNVDKSQPDQNIPALPNFGGSFNSMSSPAIKTLSSPTLSSSVSSAAMPSAAVSVSVTSSSSLTSLNTSADSNCIMSTSSPSGFLHLSDQAPKASPPIVESLKSEIQPPVLSNNLNTASEAVTLPNKPSTESELELGPSTKFSPTDQLSTDNTKSSDLNVVSVSQSKKPSEAPLQLSTSFLASASVSSGKNGSVDAGGSYEDEMEEEAPETSTTTELSLGSFGGFGIGSVPNPSMPKPNPFGSSLNTGSTSSSSSAITFSVPSGELFRPASFSFPSPQSSAPMQSANSGAFSGGFGAGAASPAQTSSRFGQPAQIGSGQQVLGSVLGTFGQSRQLGSGLPGSGFGAPSGFGGGFAGGSSTVGFSNAAAGGGFAGRASTGVGFAGIASSGGGFSGVASAGGGFAAAASAGGGFAAAAAPTGGGFAGAGSGGGFGAFSGQGGGGFSAFSSVGGNKPPELFTQMRK